MLDALIFLHSNGIIHGGVLPANIIFTASSDIPGWADTSKLTFFRIDNTRHASIFTDIQDLAYSIVSIMRKRAGLLSRTYFSPDVLQVCSHSTI
jgi:serine/threonine protein kinase